MPISQLSDSNTTVNNGPLMGSTLKQVVCLNITPGPMMHQNMTHDPIMCRDVTLNAKMCWNMTPNPIRYIIWQSI